jgi:hypothetical protein
MVSIFIPPTIFEEVQAVFDFPVAANQLQKIGRCYRVGIEAGDEIADVVGNNLSTRLTHFAIDAQRDPATWQPQCLANVIGVV